MVCPDDVARFSEVCREVLAFERATPGAEGVGIGRYNEKKMHAALKRFVCAREECYEIDMGQRYVADILCDGEIYEIQTGSLYPLTKKIAYYLDHTYCHVTVVHPLARRKKVIWIDPSTGATTAPSRYSYAEGLRDALAETVYISEAIATGRVGIWFLFLEEEEYRFLDGYGRDKKRGSSRFERVPVALIDELALSRPEDYAEFLTDEVPRGRDFTAAEFARAMKIRGTRDLYRCLIALVNIGVLEKGEKQGRSGTWHIKLTKKNDE